MNGKRVENISPSDISLEIKSISKEQNQCLKGRFLFI